MARRSLWRPALVGLLATAALISFSTLPSVDAHHGDIHARCDGDKPVITQRPPGTDHVTVTCVNGLPEFWVNPELVPTINPVTQTRPQAIPPDFGGWVTVWMNAP